MHRMKTGLQSIPIFANWRDFVSRSSFNLKNQLSCKVHTFDANIITTVDEYRRQQQHYIMLCYNLRLFSTAMRRDNEIIL